MSSGSLFSNVSTLFDSAEDCPDCIAQAEATKWQQVNQNATGTKTSADYYDLLSNDSVIWGSGAYCVKPRIMSDAARRWAASDNNKNDQSLPCPEESSMDSSVSAQKTTYYTHVSNTSSLPSFILPPELTLKQSLQKPAAAKSTVVLKDASGKVLVNFEKRGVLRFD